MKNTFDYTETEDCVYFFNAEKYTKKEALEIVKKESGLTDEDISENNFKDGFAYQTLEDIYICESNQKDSFPVYILVE